MKCSKTIVARDQSLLGATADLFFGSSPLDTKRKIRQGHYLEVFPEF